MESVTLAGGEAGVSPTVEWQGKAWTVGHPTQRAKAALEQACAAAAMAAARSLAGAADADTVAHAERVALDRIAAGHYRTFGAGWRELLASPRAAALSLYALVAPHHPGFTLAAAERMLADCGPAAEAALVQVYPSFLKALAAGTGLPPGQADELVAAAMAAVREAGAGRGGSPSTPS